VQESGHGRELTGCFRAQLDRTCRFDGVARERNDVVTRRDQGDHMLQPGAQSLKRPCANLPDYLRKILSIAFPFASSSISLSR
jgi:hypothetical protein